MTCLGSLLNRALHSAEYLLRLILLEVCLLRRMS